MRVRASKVFAERLRETRKARGFTQSELAAILTERGTPISKPALLRIERGERRLSLEEALAITMALNAVPAYMLSPPEGEVVAIDDKWAMDAEGLREWLRFGLWNWEPAPDEGHADGKHDRFQQRLAALALSLVDARRGKDEPGTRDAVSAIIAEVMRRSNETAADGSI